MSLFTPTPEAPAAELPTDVAAEQVAVREKRKRLAEEMRRLLPIDHDKRRKLWLPAPLLQTTPIALEQIGTWKPGTFNLSRADRLNDPEFISPEGTRLVWVNHTPVDAHKRLFGSREANTAFRTWGDDISYDWSQPPEEYEKLPIARQKLLVDSAAYVLAQIRETTA